MLFAVCLLSHSSNRVEDWVKQLGAALRKEGAVLNSVIDGSGGDILSQTSPILKHGGRVVVYGT